MDQEAQLVQVVLCLPWDPKDPPDAENYHQVQRLSPAHLSLPLFQSLGGLGHLCPLWVPLGQGIQLDQANPGLPEVQHLQ